MLYVIEHTEDMTNSRTYQLLPGRKYSKLVRVDATGRDVVAFYESATSQWHEARSWSQRGRVANAEASAQYDAMLTQALYGSGAGRVGECADHTCRHAEAEHTPYCVGEYETLDGVVHPCDCMRFLRTGVVSDEKTPALRPPMV